ncbi:MAG: DNA helicase UvrD, partial [Parcubacteria group bacterium]|nr:DNA helicase UvrD [Parcubacteria group bacterium]
MRTICDFHIHSKYSRATSKSCDLENLSKWAKIKGIDILGTGDFTHPAWFDILKNSLNEIREGVYQWNNSEIAFVASAEISCIYKEKNKTRRIHLVLLAPSLSAVEKFNRELDTRGVNRLSDGRPIMGLNAKIIVEIAQKISPDFLVIPAHAWTPWYAIFGSESGFDSFEECFDDYARYIYAIETGLSSDPAMNHRLSQLDSITLISNSDAHSPENLGREANVFDLSENLIYRDIVSVIKTREHLLYTIEFFPEEGKYHYDGHRACDISLTPEESKKKKNICPICKTELVLGVLNRVNELTDRQETQTYEGEKFVPFKKIAPLRWIIADAYEL